MSKCSDYCRKSTVSPKLAVSSENIQRVEEEAQTAQERRFRATITEVMNKGRIELKGLREQLIAARQEQQQAQVSMMREAQEGGTKDCGSSFDRGSED